MSIIVGRIGLGKIVRTHGDYVGHRRSRFNIGSRVFPSLCPQLRMWMPCVSGSNPLTSPCDSGETHFGSGGEKVLEKMNELADAVQYIAQKESELNRYSDKLRESVLKIFDLFGNPDECVVCDSREPYHGRFRFFDGYKTVFTDDVSGLLAAGTHRMRTEQESHERVGWMGEDGKILIEEAKDHLFKPKIHLSLKLDGKVYAVDESDPNCESFIGSRKGKLMIVERCGDEEETYWPQGVSRSELKQIVKERRITEFLQKYLAELNAQTEEYKQVSEVAEKLASVI